MEAYCQIYYEYKHDNVPFFWRLKWSSNWDAISLVFFPLKRKSWLAYDFRVHQLIHRWIDIWCVHFRRLANLHIHSAGWRKACDTTIRIFSNPSMLLQKRKQHHKSTPTIPFPQSRRWKQTISPIRHIRCVFEDNADQLGREREKARLVYELEWRSF